MHRSATSFIFLIVISPFLNFAWSDSLAPAVDEDDVAKAVGKYSKQLQDPEPGVRQKAAESLAALGPGAKDALPQLIAAFTDENDRVCEAVAYACAKVGPSALQPLRNALEDKNPRVRMSP